MSLIDVLKSDSHKLTPRLSLAAGLLYMISSDGEIKPEEITHLEIVLDGDNALIETALKYVKEVKFAQFLADAAAILDTKQKLCLLVNMADSLMSDGKADEEEQLTFTDALVAFGLDGEGFKDYFEIIALKNDHSIFN
jgi:uncharacterized tellurite resistance protein B-like protein